MVVTRGLDNDVDDEREAWKQSILRAKDVMPEKASGPLVALLEGTSGHHHWTETNHPRPTFCNYCREKLNGVPWHGYTCDICKVKAHRKCRDNLTEQCKWTNQSSIPQHLQFISPENSILPHQWMEGNLPMPSKCSVCEKPCGSVRKLIDYRCIWCGCCVHDTCIGNLARACSLGHSALSVISPLAMKEVTPNGTAVLREEAYGGDSPGGSPLIVLINAKSGDSQGQRIIKKFRRILNPIQVFDIIATGPDFALTFFSHLESFRVLVCGGDGTVGWVLSAFDRLNLHSKCQLAILPLGTGNDLARVLGWGHAFYDDTLLPQVVRTMERAHTKMLDRWSVLAIEGPQADAVRRYEELVIEKVRTFLEAEQTWDIIHAANQLCTTIRDLVHSVSHTYSDLENNKLKLDDESRLGGSDTMTENCNTLLGKLDRLMKSLKEDANCLEESGFEPGDDDDCSTGDEMLKKRDSVVNRANSLKKAFREVISMAEKGIDQHYRDPNTACTKRERFRKKRSKTTPSVLTISHSNLSSSSACSPPCSPAGEDPPQDDQKEFRSASCKATFEISHSQSSSSAVLTALFNAQSARTYDELEKPSIGTVHPPTPGATREPSTAYDDDEENENVENRKEIDQKSNSKKSSVSTPEDITKGSPDRPRIYSDTTLNKNMEKMKSQSLHPICSSADKMKQSHSDSSLYADYEHLEGSSSGCGAGASGSTLSPARASDSATWSRIKERKRTVGSDLGLSSSSHLRSTQYKEMCVMNNYFGIGLDAKIALEFHNKREESEKTRSRSKLFMWYGILGGKELMHRTYRNLEQRIKLECDGVPIDLPSLQGIVILNIPSYSGGANFWGRNKDGPEFTVQSFDDRILEVVALFGVIHVATSRVPNAVRLQNHRIAQCRHVRIVILGDEPIPVQVDGEPWLQPPGIMQIVHKNRAQMLARNPVFDATLKKWEEQKEKASTTTAPSTPTALGAPTSDIISFLTRAREFLRLIEGEIARLGVSSVLLQSLDDANAIVKGGASGEEDPEAIDDLEEREETVASVERVVELLEDHFGFPERTRAPVGQPKLGPTPHFNFEIHGDDPDHWRYIINSIRQDMDREEAAIREARKQDLIAGKPKRSRFTAWFHKRFGTRSAPFAFANIPYWTSEEVCAWLSSIGMSEYGSTFRKNDIQGSELMHLERSDIMDIGITKIGHVKRLQSAIVDLRAQNQRARRAQARKKRVAKDYKPDHSGPSGAGGAVDKRKESSAERYADGQPSTSSTGATTSSGKTRRIPPKDGESAPAVMQMDPASTDC
ncbi:Diacylglycerol kinase [Caenorhabditis elegans]|uniref:Diacylglycerol kinase n=1 Tax=Caenorhabditis elegans TaxID=6239 RepID=D5MCN8_CAEEL|nr:Diacylglycerol kinase [Caenorhabditis elegans]CCD67664.1 Diacylglycerol kinase [Caenorhabditis elegans]|eukprot:NP_501477.2 Diacylglycerol kinase [Caenorhabditis elegans]